MSVTGNNTRNIIHKKQCKKTSYSEHYKKNRSQGTIKKNTRNTNHKEQCKNTTYKEQLKKYQSKETIQQYNL